MSKYVPLRSERLLKFLKVTENAPSHILAYTLSLVLKRLRNGVKQGIEILRRKAGSNIAESLIYKVFFYP